METKLVAITPALARKYLEFNTDNRDLRPTTVATWVGVFKRGEYRLTHQGIAFDSYGMLVDGQHRLSAIAQMPEGFSVQMLVTAGLAPEARVATDLGLHRTYGDVLGISNRLAATARMMAYVDGHKKSGITPQMTLPYVQGIKESFEVLVEHDPTIRRVWSSAAVTAAAVLNMLAGSDRDYVLLVYHALNHKEYSIMPPIAQVLMRQAEGLTEAGKLRADSSDLFCRCMRVFNMELRDSRKLALNDISRELEVARQMIRKLVLHATAPAPTPVPARRAKEAQQASHRAQQ